MLIRTTAPASLATLLLPGVLSHLHLDADDGEVLPKVKAAVGALDGPKGRLRRCLLTQTWRLVLDAFPMEPEPLRLPLPPVASVAGITYADADGATQTLPTSDYQVLGIGSDEASVIPARGKAWPQVVPWPETVKVDFVTGYGTTSDSLPEPIVEAVKQLAAHLYVNRQAVDLTSMSEIPLGIRDLLAPYRVFV
ncbi:head-tail connector protein [Pleomorphomonas carboxyditropha]|uniref:PhiE125 gp8 family phage protein n=1 Tax=Pleomorphomonas carboxyditropha TaxID=2023338 RepID=A0A2G9WQC8_9HYPH|nr:hypothetical protein [Pleomorphomonas carboxyditropha]PIO96855.1 hypothetical protein CJ014_22965 [Pleomorphomonas carboxyditropha]